MISIGTSPCVKRRLALSTFIVSSEVRNEFISVSGRRTLSLVRAVTTWPMMMSMNRICLALWRRTGSSDLAHSRPIEVPRPPLSLRNAVLAKASTALSWSMVL